MPITDVTTIPLEGEQATVFQGLLEREKEALTPIRAERNAMVTAILAGKGLLVAAKQTPGLNIHVGETSITLTPSVGVGQVERSLKLEETGT